MRGKAILSVLLAAMPMTLNEAAIADAAFDQSSVCIIDRIPSDKPPPCKEGQLLLFSPNIWGNEKMPIVVATFLCDFRYPIIHNTAGVGCIFTGRRLRQLREEMETG